LFVVAVECSVRVVIQEVAVVQKKVDRVVEVAKVVLKVLQLEVPVV